MKFSSFQFSIGILLLSFLLISNKCDKENPEAMLGETEIHVQEMRFEGDYANLWKKVDSLERNGLYRSALDVVLAIDRQASADEHIPEQIKALIHIMKFSSYFEEDEQVKAIAQMESRITNAVSPLKQLLHSITAQLYWGYYQTNQWKFLQRTETGNFQQDDIRTWDLNKLAREVRDHFLASLSDVDKLKSIGMKQFELIVAFPEPTNTIFPTMYDFLANEALNFFETARFQLHRPIEGFVLNDPQLFGNNEQFSDLQFTTPDSLSTVFFAVSIHRDLAKFRLKDKDSGALIQLTLRRLDFMLHNSVNPTKDSLYYQALDDLATIYPNHPFTAEVLFKKAEFLNERGNAYSKDQPKYQFEKKNALAICDEVIQRFPESIGANWCEHLKAQILSKSISITTEKAISTSEDLKLQIDYRNLDSLYFRLVKIDWDYFLNRPKYGRALMDELLKIEEKKSWSTSLRDFKDHQQHSVLTTVAALEYGHYLLMASPSHDFAVDTNVVAYATFFSTDLTILQKEGSKDLRTFTVLNRSSGEPIQGAQIQLYERSYDYSSSDYKFKKVEKLTTDAYGNAVLKAGKSYRSFYAHVKAGKDEFSDAAQQYMYANYDRKITTTHRTHLFTDRKIYRPGQKIYFKGIVLKTQDERHEIQANTKGKVEFLDVNYQKVAEMEYVTNEFGSFSGEFTVPQALLNGRMHIRDGSKGSTYFAVEEYKRPKFEVKVLPLEGSYKIGSMIKVNGTAKNYMGSNVDDAQVAYRVTRTMRYPVWGRYFGSFYGEPDQEVANGLVSTDDKGEFTIEFLAKADPTANPNHYPIYNYSVQIDVTDITGETQSASQSVAVAAHALNLDFVIGDKVNRQKVPVFSIKSTNLNGQFTIAKGTLTIHKLKEPKRLLRPNQTFSFDYTTLSDTQLESTFPFDDFSNVGAVERLLKEEKVFTSYFDTDIRDSVTISELKSWKVGRYVAVVKSIDEFGVEVQDIKYFTLYDVNESKAPTNQFWWTHAEKNHCEPGEYAEFIVASAAENVKVYMEAESKNGVFLQETYVLSNEQRVIRVRIKEEHRGNIVVNFYAVKEGVFYEQRYTVNVPHSDKQLALSFETFRNKLLPGEKEEWRVKIKGPKGEKVAAEVLAAMYDASLDQFASNDFSMHLFGTFYPGSYWVTYSFGTKNASLYEMNWNRYPTVLSRNLPRLNWFGYNFGNRYRNIYLMERNELSEIAVMSRTAAPMADMDETAAEEVEQSAGSGALRKNSKDAVGNASVAGGISDDLNQQDNINKTQPIQIRTNLNETAFFYPHLLTNDKGEVIISFTIPEALTRWKFISMAHTKDLKTGYLFEEIITQKDLMIQPNPPRFLREGDKMSFAAKVSNLSEKDISGVANLELFDAQTMKPITEKFNLTKNNLTFSVKKNQNAPLFWEIEVPAGISAVVYRVTASADEFSDGEESALPVLSNRMLVTESLPLPSKGVGTRIFRLEKLLQSNSSKSLKHHQLTLEYTSNPAWYAVQAMPYMMEYPYECAEQIFTRYYANALTTQIANSNPKIKQVFDKWKQSSPDAFLSNLEKNQELKGLLLEETPWVLNAKNETERKKRIGLLFDINRMASELKSTLSKLEKMQVSNGAWPWFPGMPENRYITQYIVTGMGHLDRLGVKEIREDRKAWNMIKRAVQYLDGEIVKDFERLKKHYPNSYRKEQHIWQNQIQYLYARSYFRDIPLSSNASEAHSYYLAQMREYWRKFSIQTQAMIALAAFRYDDANFPKKVLASLKERSIVSDELGMYWKDNVGGYYWHQAPIETQALLIEAFDEITDDTSAVEEMKVWLLKQKQTTDWKTTKATANAVYALLMRGTNLLSDDEWVEISVGNKRVDPKATKLPVEAGTGYFKKSWDDNEISPEMGEVKVTRKTQGVSWGALYWQYFEDLDKITPHDTPLKLEKKLFLVRLTPSGEKMTPITDNTVIKPGDKIRVRVELRTDRDLEYVHMKDMRAAGFEPVNVFSRYKYQGGIGYYESTRDAATNFFMDYVRKGTYVFEYDLRANLVGDFSNGITTIQCMYAPEFTSHSEGIRVKIGE